MMVFLSDPFENIKHEGGELFVRRQPIQIGDYSYSMQAGFTFHSTPRHSFGHLLQFDSIELAILNCSNFIAPSSVGLNYLEQYFDGQIFSFVPIDLALRGLFDMIDRFGKDDPDLINKSKKWKKLAKVMILK